MITTCYYGASCKNNLFDNSVLKTARFHQSKFSKDIFYKHVVIYKISHGDPCTPEIYLLLLQKMAAARPVCAAEQLCGAAREGFIQASRS